MQSHLERIIFSAAILIQLGAAIWWASALNNNVSKQEVAITRSLLATETLNTKVALLELRVQNLESMQRETRELINRKP
jgi:hypothetical protein